MQIRDLLSVAKKHVKDDQLIMYRYIIQELNTCRKDLGFSDKVSTVFTPRNIKELYAYMISSIDSSLIPIYKEVIENLARWLKKEVNLTGITAAEDLITFDDEEDVLSEIKEQNEEEEDDENDGDKEVGEDEDEDMEVEEDDEEGEDEDEDEDEDEEDDDGEEGEEDDSSSVDPFVLLKIVSIMKDCLDTRNELAKEHNEILVKYVSYLKYSLIANCLIGTAAIGVIATLFYKKL
jgi:hypothetical protein